MDVSFPAKASEQVTMHLLVKSSESQVVLVKREREMMIQQSSSAGACTYPLEHRPPANQQMNGNGNY